ncbi:MAG: hypothetical protein CM15mP65_06980 [Crocinitomicaceae bacterium]|nr:MAG: hypothetical protein CM15mP65_06980 [Crocinitomicaceae bacterium]
MNLVYHLQNFKIHDGLFRKQRFIKKISSKKDHRIKFIDITDGGKEFFRRYPSYYNDSLKPVITNLNRTI